MKISLIFLILCLTSFSVLGKTITLMNYNAENLFDTVHDEGKEDYTYLPLTLKQSSLEIQNYCNSLTVESWRESCLTKDWSEDVLAAKIKNLSRVIKAAHKGRGADIVVLQEVENKNVLNILVSTGLKGMGYKYISLVEGPDKRGIDVGILSRYPVVNEKLHLIDLTGIAKPTRGILETTLKVENKTVTIFGNHWPSQHNPSEARFIASEKLIELAHKAESNIIVATGDFNTLETDLPNGIDNLKNAFIDAEVKARNNFFNRLFRKTWSGTHWYKGHWSSLDKIFIFKKTRKARAKYKSFDILSYKFLLGSKELINEETSEVMHYRNVPLRFNSIKKVGNSDHLPIFIEIKL